MTTYRGWWRVDEDESGYTMPQADVRLQDLPSAGRRAVCGGAEAERSSAKACQHGNGAKDATRGTKGTKRMEGTKGTEARKRTRNEGRSGARPSK